MPERVGESVDPQIEGQTTGLDQNLQAKLLFAATVDYLSGSLSWDAYQRIEKAQDETSLQTPNTSDPKPLR